MLRYSLCNLMTEQKKTQIKNEANGFIFDNKPKSPSINMQVSQSNCCIVAAVTPFTKNPCLGVTTLCEHHVSEKNIPSVSAKMAPLAHAQIAGGLS